MVLLYFCDSKYRITRILLTLGSGANGFHGLALPTRALQFNQIIVESSIPIEYCCRVNNHSTNFKMPKCQLAFWHFNTYLPWCFAIFIKTESLISQFLDPHIPELHQTGCSL